MPFVSGPRAARRHLATALFALLLLSPAVALAYWPTWGGDSQRTHQSAFDGPTSLDEVSVERYTADCDVNINTSVTIDDEGRLFFGSWGIGRTDGTDDRTGWSKGDGKIYGLS